MTFEAIVKDIRAKQFKPLYFLHGEEPYYIDEIAEKLENGVLDESEREFNQTILYGRDVELSALVGYAKRFPMMAEHQVIVVREAQDLKGLLPTKGDDEDESVKASKAKGKGKGKNEPSVKELFLAYLEKPLPSTILVFCCKYKKLAKNTKLYKAIEKNGVIFESAALKEYQIAAWIEGYLRPRKYRMDPNAGRLLSEYLGNDLSKIVNELDKLMLNIKTEEEISTAHIEKYIGISKDFNIFELQKAIGTKNAQQTFRIVKHFAANKKEHPLIMTIAFLYGFFTKLVKYHQVRDKSQAASALGLPPFVVQEYAEAARHYPPAKLAQVISTIAEFDLKSKGVNVSSVDDGEFLKELAIRILN